MTCKNNGCSCSETKILLTTAQGIQTRKMELLFQYLRDVQELNQQLKTLHIAEDMAELQKEHDRKMGDLLLQYGK